MIKFYGREVYSGIITLNDALEENANVKGDTDKLKEPTKSKILNKKKKALTFEK